MTMPRRRVLQSLGMAVFVATAAENRPMQITCSGRVTYASGRSGAGKTIQLMGVGARVAETRTDTEGNYRVPPPEKGEYVLLLFEPQGDQLAEVKQLTGGTNQSVTHTSE